MWFYRLLNRFGLRRDIMVCMRQEDTYQWADYLGAKTAGFCAKCKEPIFFEKQNKPFHKICNPCASAKPNTHPVETPEQVVEFLRETMYDVTLFCWWQRLFTQREPFKMMLAGLGKAIDIAHARLEFKWAKDKQIIDMVLPVLREAETVYFARGGK